MLVEFMELENCSVLIDLDCSRAQHNRLLLGPAYVSLHWKTARCLSTLIAAVRGTTAFCSV
jgi:hypothetical protein